MKKFGFSRKVSTADIKKEVQKKELSPLKETATSKTVPELENKPSPANEAIPPHSARDLVAAMEYFEKYHSSFDGNILAEPISETILNQVELLIATSKRMETPNFYFFNSCPVAVIYFIKNYLECLEETLLGHQQVVQTFKIFSAMDPLARVSGFQKLLKKNKNKGIIRQLILLLERIYCRSKEKKITLERLSNLFAKVIFRYNDPTPRQEKKLETKIKFLIQHAKVVFPEESDAMNTKTMGNGMECVQLASRWLGTDGILYLLEEELNMIEIDLQKLSNSYEVNFIKQSKEELNAIEEDSVKVKDKLRHLYDNYSSRFSEVEETIDRYQPAYNSLDFLGETA